MTDIDKLRKFAREIIKDYCWNLGDPDGGSIHDLAEKLGLIEPCIATKEDVDDYEVGDTIYKFSKILKTDTDEEATKADIHR